MTTPQIKPWHVRAVEVDPRGGISCVIDNAYSGRRNFWSLDFYTFRDPDFVRRHYSFKGAVWGPGARDRFALVVRRARAAQRASASQEKA